MTRIYQRQYEYCIEFVHVVSNFVEPPAKPELKQVFTTRSTGTCILFADSSEELPVEIHELKEKNPGIRRFLKALKLDAIKKYVNECPMEPVPHVSNIHVTRVKKFKALGHAKLRREEEEQS